MTAADLRESQMERADLLIERDALAARLAAVKALHRPAYFEDTPEVAYCAHCQASGDPFAPAGRTWPCATAAALSAAPTDTTKETP